MDTQKMEEQVKQFAKEWRTRLEDMQVQFSLGKMDATEAFEKQKNYFRDLTVKMKSDLDKAGDSTKENVTELRGKLDDLFVQLSLGKADGKDLFEEQKKKIEVSMNEVLASAKQLYNQGFDSMLKMYDNNSNAFKTGLEILKLQFALGKMDSKDEAEKLRKEMTDKMNDLTANFKNAENLAKENIDLWNEKMKEGFEKMKTFTDGFMKQEKK